MIKYIGQHIFDFIARFRNDIYLENIADGTVDSDKFLGLDSSGKVVKEAVVSSSGDITAVTITTDSGGGSAASETSGSADFSILGSSGVGVTNSGTTITAVAVPAEIDHDSLQNFAANEHYTQANIVATGALDSGSITSGFGNIDIGSSTFDTTGAVTTGILQPVAIKHVISGNSAGDYGSGAEILYNEGSNGGVSFTTGAIYVLRAGQWNAIDCSSVATTQNLCAVALGADTSSGMLIKGCVTLAETYEAGSDSGGHIVYGSATDSGRATLTAPTSSGHFVRILGYSLNVSSKKMFFNPDSTYVEIA
tara:strand:+ start:411 stop:1334 length:924 start_codon:yes stop_codon:yes gene_type:complete